MLKRTHTMPITTRNGSAALPADLAPFVPAGLAARISEIVEQEGQMDGTAERRILTEIATNHKENIAANAANHRENQTAIAALRETLARHDTRLTVVENSIAATEKAQATAAGERRSTARQLKGALIGLGVMVVAAAVMGYYNLKPVQQAAVKQEAKQEEAVRQDTALITILEKLNDRLDRQEKATPAPVSTPGRRGQVKPRPEPPRINMLRDGELHADKDRLPPPMLSSNRIPILEMTVPK